MAKFVCDFGEVRDAGKKLIESSSDIESSTKAYSSSMESDLSGWNGQAKTAFEGTNANLVTTATSNTEYMTSLGEFIVSAADAIESLEGELSGLSI